MTEYWIRGGYCSISELQKKVAKKLCQDSIYIASDIEQNFLCMAVADGAGSAILSDIGANAVTKTVCRLLEKKFLEFYEADPFIVKRKIIHSLRTSLGIIAKNKNAIIKDLASTLLFVCIKNKKIIVGHIGDGLILYKKDGEIKILSEPENGEFINQTYFVTSSHYKHHLRLYKGSIDDITGFYLMTDGVASGANFNWKKKTVSENFIKSISVFSTKSDSVLQNQIYNLMKTKIVNQTTDDSTLGVILLKD